MLFDDLGAVTVVTILPLAAATAATTSTAASATATLQKLASHDMEFEVSLGQDVP